MTKKRTRRIRRTNKKTNRKRINRRTNRRTNRKTGKVRKQKGGMKKKTMKNPMLDDGKSPDDSEAIRIGPSTKFNIGNIQISVYINMDDPKSVFDIHLSNVEYDLNKTNFISNNFRVETKRIDLDSYTDDLRKVYYSLSEYIKEIEQAGMFDYNKFLECNIVHVIALKKLRPNLLELSRVLKSLNLFANRNFDINDFFLTGFYMNSPNSSPWSATELMKVHISVKKEFFLDSLRLLNDYPELDTLFPIFKFILPGFRHIEYRTNPGFFSEFSSEEYKDYFDKYYLIAGCTGSANIVLYPRNEDSREVLGEIMEFKEWWNSRCNESWSREQNYLLFNIRLGPTLFFAYGYDTSDRHGCHKQKTDRKCRNFIRDEPIQVIKNLRDKYCTGDESHDPNSDCLRDNFNLTREQLCDKDKYSLSSIYGLNNNIHRDMDLNVGDELCQ